MHGEAERIAARYARRRREQRDLRTSDPLAPHVWMMRQEKERALVRWIRRCGLAPPSTRLLEIGCGRGRNLQDFLRLGFRPENLAGVELLPESARAARRLLPAAIAIYEGNALELDFAPASFQVVCQFTVFTSILDARFQEELARRMWSWAAPGGGVLWYDFTWDNPRNPDVEGVPPGRVRELFPHGRLASRRVTLAPPLARAVTRLHPALYTLLNMLPPLRTHLLCWIAKP